MLKALKRVIREWLKEDESPFVSPQPVQAAPTPQAAPQYNSETTFLKANGVKPVIQTTSDPNGRLALPLRSILKQLPADVMRLVRQLDVGDALVSLPTPQILAQIPKGSVRVTFAELKKASPPGVFSHDSVLDKTLVELPLKDIIARLDPSLLARKSTQQQVVVPPEIAGPFGGTQGREVMPVSAPLTSPSAVKAAPPMQNHTTTFIAKAADAKPKSTQTSFIGKGVGLPPAQASESSGAKSDAAANGPLNSPVKPSSFNTSRITKQPAAPAAPSEPPAAPVVPMAGEDVFSKKPAPSEPVLTPRMVTPIDPGPAAVEPPSHAVPSPAELPAARPMPAGIISPIIPEPLPEPQPIRFQPPVNTDLDSPVPKPAPAPNASSGGVTNSKAAPAHAPADNRVLVVSLGELCRDWPETLQQEILTHHAQGSTVSLPFAMIQVALKQGKVALPWRIIRTWLQPASPNLGTSHDSEVLELPLKVITPLFMAEMKNSKPRKKVVIDQSIPDLFSGDNQAEKPAAPASTTASSDDGFKELHPAATTFTAAQMVPLSAPRIPSLPVPEFTKAEPEPLPVAVAAARAPKQADTNYFSKPEGPDVTKDVVPNGERPPSLGTTFMKRYATPNEIVSKTAALPGVEGALVALPDGLLVASEIPATMNAHTVAGFLPQMFAKVSQCTKELRLGELNNLSFTVGVVPWKIYKVGAIYFAAFGREGESIPTAELAKIAAELDRNGKN